MIGVIVSTKFKDSLMEGGGRDFDTVEEALGSIREALSRAGADGWQIVCMVNGHSWTELEPPG